MSSQKGRTHARVGIVYTESSTASLESRNLAHYLCCGLVSQGYASVFLVPSKSDGSISDVFPSLKRLTYRPPNSSRTVEIPTSNITYSHWTILESCHIVILTTIEEDNDMTASKLIQALQSRTKVLVLNMQRGMSGTNGLRDKIQGKSGITCLDCVVGFSVIQDSNTHTYLSTIYHPIIVVPRLNKEITDIAEGPLNLLETTHIHLLYKTYLTPYEIGMGMYELIYAINALTSSTSLYTTISDPVCRRLYATMLRETSKVFQVNSRLAQLTPQLEVVSWILTPWWLEMIMLLPTPVFLCVAYVTSYPLVSYPSPLTMDLQEGKKGINIDSLSQLLKLGKDRQLEMPICQLVYDTLLSLASSSSSSYSSTTTTTTINVKRQESSHIQTLLQQLPYDFDTNTRIEFNYYMIRFLAIILFILLLLFIFIHEE